jgi:pimeloyl-ACP methyl ester carboxylesterase
MRSLTVASTDGVQLHVVTNVASDGSGPDGPLLLFIHGYPDTHRSWAHQLTAFQGDHRVAAFDLRGAGQSTTPPDMTGYAIERVLPDLTAVIDAVARPGERVHLVAHDWGALISWRYISEPDLAARVASYTCLAGPHPDMAMALQGQRLRSGKLGDWAEFLHQLGMSWYVGLFQVPGLAEWRWRRDWQRLWVGIHRRGGVPSSDPLLQAAEEEVLSGAIHPLNYYRAAGRQWAKGALTLPAEPIRVPVNLLIPDRDLALSPRLYENVPDYVPDLRIHHLEANHWAHHSHAELVNALIREFIAEQHAVPPGA